MTDTAKPAADENEQRALDGISVSPPVPDAADSDVGAEGAAPASTPPIPEIREARDAEDDAALKADPADADAKLDVALDETFPTSDAPSNTRPGSSGEPAPSSGFDEEEEARRARDA